MPGWTGHLSTGEKLGDTNRGFVPTVESVRTNPIRTILWTRDERVGDAVLSTAAALGVGVEAAGSLDDLVRRWGAADLVLVGGDEAAGVAGASPPRRERVFVVGFDAGELSSWSVPIGAEVIPLPHGSAWLSAVMSAEPEGHSPLVAVVGGSGGVGASTLAAGLSYAARRRGLASALVDADPCGGGLDLLVGAERSPGWRWPRLSGARGEVSDVRQFLPQAEGVTLVSMGRPDPGGGGADAVGPPSPESLQAVLGSLLRHHDLVVVDAGRAPAAGVRQQLRVSSTVLVAGADVRAVAAADATRRSLELESPLLAVRAGPVPAPLVGEALGLAVAGAVPTDRRVARAAEAGAPPGRSARGPWAKAVDRLLATVLEASDEG